MTEPLPNVTDLFTPHDIKGALRNRFVMPGMQRGRNALGAPRAEVADYYRRRVEGGVTLIVSESCAVAHPTATAQPAAAKIDASTLAAWQRCVHAVNQAGGTMLLQLWHEVGVRNPSDGLTRSPSGFGRPGKPNGAALSPVELAELRTAYVESAAMAKLTGAAGVEIHACHGYLIDQFLWPDTNRRDDEYGGEDIRHRVTISRRDRGGHTP